MKKIVFTLCALALSIAPMLAQDINIDPDSLYKEAPASEYEFSMLSHVVNTGTQNVTLKWDRNIEQIPNGWTTNFCDKNLCYSGSVSTHQFDLFANGDSSILKPIFRPNNVPGMCIYRITLTSQTPAIPYVESMVYVAVATVVNDVAEILSDKDVVVFPNPATDELTVVVADAHFKGSWSIVNATGQKALTRPQAQATEQVDVSSLAPGVYFLNIWTIQGQLVATKKFFIQ